MASKKTDKKRKYVLPAIVIAVAVLAIAAINCRFLYPTKTFEIIDNCGVVTNTVMHTIDDGDICKARCVNQCDATGMQYLGFDYESVEKSCNKCSCTCRVIGK